MVKQIDFVIAVSRIRIIGIAIITGLIVIFLFGLFVSGNNKKENFEIINLSSLILLIILTALAFIVRNMILKKVDLSNILTTFFNAYIIPFVILDFGALFCISTNLFVNENILYASAGIIISVAGMILMLPREDQFEDIKNKSLTKDTASGEADIN
ncbi:MAG: hypothetical protein HGGPFJEG_02614 [Ignavibacteria bacterium]|nr:hypothetical protein [Ignavibacteria bacterium]